MNNKILKRTGIGVIALLGVVALSGCFGNTKTTETPMQPVATEDKMMDKKDDEMMKDKVMDKGDSMSDSKSAQDVVDVAIGSPDHITLVTAVQTADLVDTLKGDGPFTIFAPVNSAFDALPAGTLDSLLKPENKDQLVGLLTYHVVPSKAMSSDVLAGIEQGNGVLEVGTVSGGKLMLKKGSNGVTVTDENGNVANVTVVDLVGSNGVVHVIDTVLLPHSS